MIDTYFKIKSILRGMPKGSFAVTKRQEHDQVRTVFVLDPTFRKVLRRMPESGREVDDVMSLFGEYWKGIKTDDFAFYRATLDDKLNVTFEKQKLGLSSIIDER